MIKVKITNLKQCAFQPLSKIQGIAISISKECIISVKVFSRHTAIEQITMFDETVKPIYIILMIKALLTIIVIIAVLTMQLAKEGKTLEGLIKEVCKRFI